MSAATASTGGCPPIMATLEQIKKVMDDFKLRPCPIAELMKKQGFDPADGCFMVLPDSYKDQLNESMKPSYLKFSNIVSQPMLLRDPYFRKNPCK